MDKRTKIVKARAILSVEIEVCKNPRERDEVIYGGALC